MEKTYTVLTKIQNVIRSVLSVISAVGLIAGTGMVFIFTILRYAFGLSFGWGEEVIRIIILLGVFLMAGTVNADGGTVSFSLFYDKVKSPYKRKILNIISMIVAAVMGLVMFKWGLDVFQTVQGQMTISGYMPKQVQYFSIPAGMILILIVSILKLIQLFIELKQIKDGTYVEAKSEEDQLIEDTLKAMANGTEDAGAIADASEKGVK